jgi:hypothetical protein
MGDQYNIANVRAFGAVGDGVVDDRAAFQAAIDLGDTVYVPAGMYRLTNGLTSTKPVRILGQGVASKINMVAGSGALLFLGGGIANGTPNPGYAGTVYNFGTAALSAGQYVYTCADTTGLAVGDVLFLDLGIDPQDGGQHYIRQWNVVAGIAGDQVTLRSPLPEAVGEVGAPAYAFSPTFHEAVKVTTPANHIEVGHLSIEQSAGESAVFALRARNVHVHDLFFPNTSARAVIVGECDNVVVERLLAQRSTGTYAFVNLYGCRNSAVRDVRAALVGSGIDLENQMRGFTLERIVFEGDSADKNAYGYLRIGGHSLDGSIRDVEITNAGTVTALLAQALVVGSQSQITTENVSLCVNASIFPLKYHRGQFNYRGTTYRNRVRATVDVSLVPNMEAVGYALPSGLLCRLKGMISTRTGVLLVRLHSNSTGGYATVLDTSQSIDRFPADGVLAEMTTDQFVTVGDSPLYTFNTYTEGHMLRVTTDGTVPEGATLQLETEFFTA